MLRIQLLLLSLIVCICFSCRKSQELPSKQPGPLFKPQLISLMVHDLETSLNWYTDKLGFVPEGSIQVFPDYNLRIAFLRLDEFRLELIENPQAVAKSNLPIGEESSLNGLLKLGFMVNDIEGLFQRLKGFEDVQFLTDIGNLPSTDMGIPWPDQFFLINDPDGNLIQFFAGSAFSSPKVMIPWLALLTVKDLEAVSHWYITNLGFKYRTTVGEEGNMRTILSRKNFILELFAPANVEIYEKLEEKPEYEGIRKLAFGVHPFDSAFQRLEERVVDFVMEPTASDLDWASQHMILLDPEGNWIQLLEPR